MEGVAYTMKCSIKQLLVSFVGFSVRRLLRSMVTDTYATPAATRQHPPEPPAERDLALPSLFSDSFWKRFREGIETFPAPVITLDTAGTIQNISAAARRMLRYAPHETIDSYFFTHVHGHNMHRVMRDLAHMVNAHTQRASWLVRLQTAKGRWRWFRIHVANRLNAAEECILLRLRPA